VTRHPHPSRFPPSHSGDGLHFALDLDLDGAEDERPATPTALAACVAYFMSEEDVAVLARLRRDGAPRLRGVERIRGRATVVIHAREEADYLRPHPRSRTRDADPHQRALRPARDGRRSRVLVWAMSAMRISWRCLSICWPISILCS
jgi:hypothetical protein